jgi:hypothetical protein
VSAADHSAIGFAQKDAEQLSVSNAGGLDIELMEPLFEPMPLAKSGSVSTITAGAPSSAIYWFLLRPRLILAQIALGPKLLPMMVMGHWRRWRLSARCRRPPPGGSARGAREKLLLRFS